MLVFLLVYASFLLGELDYASIKWDEIPHLQGGLLLLRGQTEEYMGRNAFYPPLFDSVTAGYFVALGVSVFSGRFVALIFSILSLWIVFELANRLYKPSIALLSSVILAAMPSFFWLSRMVLIETMLIFFVSLSMFFFIIWLQTKKDRMLVFSGLAVGLGFLAKYQMLITVVVMLASLLLLCWNHLKRRLTRFPILIVVAILIALPWLLASYQIFLSGMFEEWLYVLRMGTQERAVYSFRFPVPIFYLIELTWPYAYLHPISLSLYIISLLGLGFFVYRRKVSDKFLTTWFVVFYLFFTVISNRHWRYLMPVFPVLAISASNFTVSIFDGLINTLKAKSVNVNRNHIVQASVVVLVIIIVISLLYSFGEAYYLVESERVRIPIEEASFYAGLNMAEDEGIMVLFACNSLKDDMVKFYLNQDQPRQIMVWQYPFLAVDAFTPNLELYELVIECQNYNVKYLFMFEYGNLTYFNSDLTYNNLYEVLNNTERFSLEKYFGTYPNGIFIWNFQIIQNT